MTGSEDPIGPVRVSEHSGKGDPIPLVYSPPPRFFRRRRTQRLLVLGSLLAGLLLASLIGWVRWPGKAGPRVPLKLRLPPPVYISTPKDLSREPNMDRRRYGPRPPLMVPQRTLCLSRGKPVTCSDPLPTIGQPANVADGQNGGMDYELEISPGLQWVQIDLQATCAVSAICVWHGGWCYKVYHDVVVQVSSDPNFINDVHTVFNNDYDNSSGLGKGGDKSYLETNEGKLIDAQGVPGRYVRLYSNGSNSDDQNSYTEVEVYGYPLTRREIVQAKLSQYTSAR
jgi:hypothetical protein